MIEKSHEIVSLAHHIWNVISAISLDDDVENKCNAFQLDIGSIVNPFPIHFKCQPHTPQLQFILGWEEIGVLLVIILQF
jgi:hypothetical protein